MATALLGRDDQQLGSQVQHRTDPVARACGEEADPGGGGQRQVPLFPGVGAKVEAGGEVDAQPRFQLAVGDRLADVGRLHAGGDVPVDASGVVPGRIDAGLARLGAVPGNQSAVLTVEDAIETSVDVELQSPQHLLGAGGRRVARRCPVGAGR